LVATLFSSFFRTLATALIAFFANNCAAFFSFLRVFGWPVISKPARRQHRAKEPVGATDYYRLMNTLLLIVVLLLLLGGGGFYYGGPAYGGGGIGLILLICLIIYLFGGFRGRN
jgi:hypothetical protein